MSAKDNPLGMSVYKMAGNDGKGAWFARRSVHEGLGFARWKRGLEREFPETMKVQGGPGEGNIRGIGGERRLEFREVQGTGRLEVYHLSAQFPGPTTPRDFVTLLLTSDNALTDETGGVFGEGDRKEVPRHFMVVSKPCIHAEAPEREGFIRGQYQSVELIREVPLAPQRKKSASMNDLSAAGRSRKMAEITTSGLGREAIIRNANKSQSQTEEHDAMGLMGDQSSTTRAVGEEGRKRGKTISFAGSREEDDPESNPVEWIMLTRSDPGGSVPRFMVERGTPGSIVADAAKFLDWACSKDIDEFGGDEVASTADVVETTDQTEPDGEEQAKPQLPRRRANLHPKEITLHDYQTNGHLAGLNGIRDSPPDENYVAPDSSISPGHTQENAGRGGGLYGMMSSAASLIASHTPAIITSHLPSIGYSAALPHALPRLRRYSTSSTSSSESSDAGTFASALEGPSESESDAERVTNPLPTTTAAADTNPTRFPLASPPISASASTKSARSTPSTTTGSGHDRLTSAEEKERAKLAERKRKLGEKLGRIRQRELSRTTENSSKEAAAIARAESKYAREVRRQEEKCAREVERIRKRREREEKKAGEVGRRDRVQEEVGRLKRGLKEISLENEVLRVEKDLLRRQVGELQKENTRLAVGIGKLGEPGERVLQEVREGRAASFVGAQSKEGQRLRAASSVMGKDS